MKFALVLAAILAGTSASVVPQEPQNPQTVGEIDSRQARFVEDLVSSALEAFSQSLRDAGMDPLTLATIQAGYELPVPVLFSAHALVENVRVTGISNIVINSISSSGLLTLVLSMDISLPEIAIAIDNAEIDLTILGHNFAASTNSRLSIIQPRISGEVQINLVGAIIGNLITRLDLEFDLEALRFDGNLLFQGVDYAGVLNNFVSVTVPTAIDGVRAEINELIEIIGWQLVDQLF